MKRMEPSRVSRVRYCLKCLTLAFGVVLFCVLLSGCLLQSKKTLPDNQQVQPISKQGFQLDTLVTLTIYDKKDETLLQEAEQEIHRLEQLLSVSIPGSDPERLARYAGLDFVEVGEETAFLLPLCSTLSAWSDGAFDCTVGPLVALWNIKDTGGYYPSTAEREEALSFVDYRDVHIRQDGQVMLAREGMRIDFGAIAKGYIADQVKALLVEKGVRSGLVDLGGNILLIGEKPGGEAFRVGARDPEAGPSDYFGVFTLRDKSLVSSGPYQRFFVHENTAYHHIMDTSTGFPVDNTLLQVTIVSDSSALGDGLSTTAYALGLEKGLSLIRGMDGVDAVFVTKEKTVYVTEGIQDAFTIVSEAYTMAAVEDL